MTGCPMELAGGCRTSLLGFGRKPGAREVVWHQRGLKNGVKKSRNSLQLSLRASTFCRRAQRYFHFLRINSPKLSQHCIHVCGTAGSTLHCTGQRELRAGSCLTAPAFTITVWLAGRGELRLVWGRSQCAEGLLHLGNATEVGIAHHPVLDHSRRRPASDDQPI